jgi:hypothetical protein
MSCSSLNRSIAFAYARPIFPNSAATGSGTRDPTEPDHLPLSHQHRHIPLQELTIDRPDLKGHMIGE